MKRHKIFICYAHEDRRFVPLAAKLLEAHNHEPWFAQCHLRGGDLFARKIDEELASSDVLIVVASPGAASSTWVTTEIAKFQTSNPSAPVIPLLLEPVDLNDISPGLADFQAVDFTECLLSGFRDLFTALGNDFLSRKEMMNRRAGAERRSGEDRRKAGVAQRLSMGLLVTYTRSTGRSVAEATLLSPGDTGMLEAPARVELRRYCYTDLRTGREAAPDDVVENALRHVRERMQSSGSMDAVEVLRVVAEFVCERYDVRFVDRRSRGRRREDRQDET